MKKLLYILTLFITAFSSLSVMPPGWYVQTLPVNDFVNDIYFADTLNGWIVTQGNINTNDTAYIMKTTNGGDNWAVQFNRVMNFNVVQFLNTQTGYAGGGSGNGNKIMYKTSNGGNTWNQIINSTGSIDDEYFINNDTGWYCDSNPLDGGLWKTTNGGVSWIQQLNQSYHPLKLFFLNKDTGWVGTNDANGKLYRTTNGGTNWNLQYIFNSTPTDIFFFNQNTGIVGSGINKRTTDGGFSWIESNDGGRKISMVNDSIGWAGSGFNKIMKTTNGGVNWYQQYCPIFSSFSVFAVSNNIAWGGGSGLVETNDGGGMTGISQINTKIPDDFKLYQNYPNPFNPETVIEFEIKKVSDIKLEIFDITGRTLDGIAYQKLSPGKYQYIFKAENLTSGIYFYRLLADKNTIDTRKMLLVK